MRKMSLSTRSSCLCRQSKSMMPLRNSLRRYWLTLLNILKSANVKTRVKSCLSPKGITQFRCFSGVSASFNWKMASSLSVLRPVFRRGTSYSYNREKRLAVSTANPQRKTIQKAAQYSSKTTHCGQGSVVRLYDCRPVMGRRLCR